MKTKIFIKSLIVLMIFLLCACGYTPNIPVKPYVIFDKYPQRFKSPNGAYVYSYYDANGRKYTFIDTTKYKIGDTIN